ncbi:hypothetical protein KI440_01365 [Candidatus Saccharibacteria bacterium TM7i]|nr:hypothetical protein KI440_01365 [Candidatus Saccharibacteria bacterium TM7i]
MRISLRRRIHSLLLVLAAGVLVFANTSTAQALDTQFHSSNDILFYGEEGGLCGDSSGTSGGSAPTSLRGDSVPEKIWNYLIDRGMTPIAAAGIMGNMEAESAFNPWVTNGIGAFGLVQWLGGRANGVKAKLSEAGITPADYNDANIDKGIMVELEYLWSEGPPNIPLPFSDIAAQLNREKEVGGDTSIDGSQWDSYKANEGNGSVLYFHAAIERSSNEGIETRIQSGKTFMEQFGGAGGSGSGGDCGSIGEGGMTIEQAEALMKWWVANRDVTVTKADYCNGIDKYQCFSFSSFVHHYILGAQCVNGGAYGADVIATGLISQGWKKVTEDTIQPFTVTQHPNEGDGGGNPHTFVVLGIQGGKIIVGENDGGNYNDNFTNTPGFGPNAKVYTVDSIAHYREITGPYVGDVFAAPPDPAAATQAMTKFMQEKGIGG